jgi:hypothetical protein
MFWGRAKRSQRVHLFVNGKRQCMASRGTPWPAVDKFPEWDINDPDTCQRCKERYYWLMKGAIPAITATKAPTA